MLLPVMTPSTSAAAGGYSTAVGGVILNSRVILSVEIISGR